jgi:hypothetical protein
MKNNKLLPAGLTVLLLANAASASASLLANGTFDTGSLSGWTTFTSNANGTLGSPGVVSFDVTGTGASNAARFRVGQINAVTGNPQGGGILQNFATGAGLLSVTLDVAVETPTIASVAQGGLFTVFLDGIEHVSHDFGFMPGNETQRASLAFDLPVVAGTHEFKVLLTRVFTAGSTAAPYQYLDNIVATLSPLSEVPEPGALALFGIGAAAFRLASRKPRP